MPDNVIAAERTWFAVAPDGSEHDVVLRITAPTLQPGGEWRAPVSLGALEPHIHNIAGVDAWQAVSLAMRFAATRVGHFAENGWRFYWERGGELASSTELANAP
jgi:hypothetical protein